ncbi:MAG: hypothetical protein CMO01_02910 [Thalassobius sp.]|nr:hypothetical protein [Thalassovita sp.]
MQQSRKKLKKYIFIWFFIIGVGLVGYKYYNPDFLKKDDQIEILKEEGLIDKIEEEIKFDSLNKKKPNNE